MQWTNFHRQKYCSISLLLDHHANSHCKTSFLKMYNVSHIRPAFTLQEACWQLDIKNFLEQIINCYSSIMIHWFNPQLVNTEREKGSNCSIGKGIKWWFFQTGCWSSPKLSCFNCLCLQSAACASQWPVSDAQSPRNPLAAMEVMELPEWNPPGY